MQFESYVLGAWYRKGLIDVEFTLGLIWFYPHTNVCKHSVLSRVLLKHFHGNSGWIRTHQLCQSRAAAVLQLDRRDCLVAIDAVFETYILAAGM